MPNRKAFVRSVHFFGLVAKTEKGTELAFKDLKTLFLDIEKISSPSGNVTPKPENGFVDSGGNVFLCMRNLDISDKYIFGWIGYTRNDDLPLIIHQRELRKIQLEEGDYIFEPTSFLLLPNKALLIEYNNSGPRNYSLSTFLTEISGSCPLVSCKASDTLHDMFPVM